MHIRLSIILTAVAFSLLAFAPAAAATNSAQPTKMFLFHKVFSHIGYGFMSGIAGAVASNKEEAIDAIIERFKKDYTSRTNHSCDLHGWNNIYECQRGEALSESALSRFRKELEDCKSIEVLSLEVGAAFFSGGSHDYPSDD